MWDNAPLAAFLVEHFVVLSNSEYNVYSLRLESTAIRLMSFSCIELLVATLVNVASGRNVITMSVKNSETGSLRFTGLNLLLLKVLVPFCFHTFMPMKRNVNFASFRLSRAVFGLCYVILVLVDSYSNTMVVKMMVFGFVYYFPSYCNLLNFIHEFLWRFVDNFDFGFRS